MISFSAEVEVKRCEILPQLQRGTHGIKSNAHNLALVLTEDLRCQNIWRLNTFINRVECSNKFWIKPSDNQPTSGDMTESDYHQVRVWVNTHYEFDPSVSDVMAEVFVVGARASFNPLVDYLNSLAWDGTPRIDTWLLRHLGVEETDYSRNVARKWLISAVARAMNPGCQVDTVLILEGTQGLGKTSSLRALASPEYYTDTAVTLGDKDSRLLLQRAWIVELAELASFKQAEKLKAFLSQREDLFRRPYGRTTEHFPRHCVFAGTTNASDYLQDDTGNRRYWPVRTTKQADINALKAERDQLWAEAVHAYKKGEVWYFNGELCALAAEETDERMNSTPLESIVSAWVEKRGRPLIAREEVLTFALRRRVDSWPEHPAASINWVIQRAMKANGFHYRAVSRSAKDEGGKRVKLFIRTDAAPSKAEIQQAVSRRAYAIEVASYDDKMKFETAVENDSKPGAGTMPEA